MAEEKLNLCLKQAEWLLFQANIFDVEINPDSMRVIVEARRVVSGGKKEKDIDQFVEIASHAYADEGGIHTPDHRFTLNKYSVAWLCWHVGCVCCGRISITGTAGSEIKVGLDPSLLERLSVMLNHVEWVVFQASLLGLRSKEGSLSGVVEAKRSLLDGKPTKNLKDASDIAHDVLK